MPLDENADYASLSAESGSPSVTFDFNPATITIAHRVQARSAPGQVQGQKSDQISTSTLASPAQMAEAMGTTTVTLRELVFVGTKVQNTCELLYNWTVITKVPNQSKEKVQDLPKLTFRWGPLKYPVNLNQVTINYTRFNRGGKPVRATVDLTLHVIEDKTTKTNPTSGGPAGRQSHVLTGAETLAGLATKTYGSPGGWRQIAAANGIQDPLRVKPGTLVYLPGEEEAGR